MSDASAFAFRVMGVVNVTPDSFSDGGRYLDADAAVAHGLELARQGAAIVDVGGESTRPGATPVSIDEELRRVLPVIERLAQVGSGAEISVDTSKAAVASAALRAGATIVNDVTALRGDPDMAAVIAAAGAGCCLMHMLGDPRTMQDDPHYDDVVGEVKQFLAERLELAVGVGIDPRRIMLDPGIGFGKTDEHNLELVARVDELVELGQPVVIGTSRKGFLGRLTGRDRPEDRLAATVSSCVIAYERGARVFRVHDVRPVLDALTLAAATVARRWRTTSSTR